MNLDREEARDELYQTIRRTSVGREAYERGIIRAIRAYALLVHVEACDKQRQTKPKFFWTNHDERVGLGERCGNGWYCVKAQQYLPTNK